MIRTACTRAARGAMAALAEVSRGLLAVALPPTCLCCGDPVGHEPARSGLCPECGDALAALASREACPRCARSIGPYGSCAGCAEESPPFQAAVRIGGYAGPLAELVRAVKYRDARYAVPLVAELLLAKLHQSGAVERADLLTAVPLHWYRFYRRGYNQAWLVARELQRRGLRLPLERLLVRTRDTRPQVGLSKEARQENVRGAFRVRRPERVRGRRILLVDDVMTTGATLGACTRALRGAGAAEVIVAVAGRAESAAQQRLV